jgi:hypothetical protein
LGHVTDPSGCLAHCGPAAKFWQAVPSFANRWLSRRVARDCHQR